MSKLKTKIDNILLTFAGVLLTLMVILSIWQVAARYILNTPSTTSEEIIRFLLIWFSLISAAYVFGQGKHIAIVFIREKFNQGLQTTIAKLADIILLLVALVLMIWGGMKVIDLTLTQVAPATGVSMAIMYGALPISGLFITFYSIHSLVTSRSSTQEDGGETF